MRRRTGFALSVSVLVLSVLPAAHATPSSLFVGASKQDVTPYTGSSPASNPDGLVGGDPSVPDWIRTWSRFDGAPTPSGVWGEPYEDADGDARFDAAGGDSSDAAESFVDDPRNTALDPGSAGKWDGIYLAGFGGDRVAMGALDKLWVRAAVFADVPGGNDLSEDGDARSFALVSGDFLGYFGDWTDRILAQAREIWPYASGGSFWLDRLVLTHTHNHQSPDVHVGLWGPNATVDGTYPLYERYIERKIALAVVLAMRDAAPATVRAGSLRASTPFTTERSNLESLAGMQSRNSCRTPWFFDDELRAFEAVAADGGRPILSLINWGTHVESLGDANTMLSSDLAGYARDQLERRLGGGVAMWLPGAQGAVEIVGDSCTSVWTRSTFDGEAFPASGESVARTRAIGRLIGDAALAALGAPSYESSPALDWVEPRDLFIPVTNQGLAALVAAGVIDKPTYGGAVASGDAAANAVASAAGRTPPGDTPFVPGAGTDVRTTLFAFRIGPASFVTSPGELFPEIYYGVGSANRSERGAYPGFSPTDAYLACSSQAANGRPAEPPVRERQVARFPGASVHFLLGYAPDLLGYIVPGYDFAIYGAPVAAGVGAPLPFADSTREPGSSEGEAPDPCADVPIDAAGHRYRRHYHETNSASSMLAPAYACTIGEMLGAVEPLGAACVEWNSWKQGAGQVLFGSAPSPEHPERVFIRSY